MRSRVGAIAVVTIAALAGAAAGAGLPGVPQDSAQRTRLVSAFAIPDGLLDVSFGTSTYQPQVITSYGISEPSVWQWSLSAEYGLRPQLSVCYEQVFRTWSNWPQIAAASGGGLGDGRLQGVFTPPGLPGWLGLSLFGGTSVPVGKTELGEGVFSPHAGVSLGVRLWRTSTLPEMRIFANWGHRWNRNEDEGYGVGLAPGPQPWWPRYPDAASAGGAGRNDMRLFGGGLEFRKASTIIWAEYAAAQIIDTRSVDTRENDTVIAAGLRWGLAEGWGLGLDYQIPLHKNAYSTAYDPELPKIVYALTLSRQFSLGGHDRDHDGIPDRKDACPELPEDRDGFQDADGCPDLDNDHDGVLDALDACPDEPEDIDGYQDADGCPDPDNDGDGIIDRLDQCPDEPEDFDGDRDTDGCPDVFIDSDGDGIADEDDLCPYQPEDIDGFEDADGCPDPDNDLDGIDDVHDQCPDQPEDYDGDRDDDGCPDVTTQDSGAHGGGG